MNSDLFARMHGGMTHFPIGLVIASLFFDLITAAVRSPDQRRDLHAAGFYALLLGALASGGAMPSGLLLTNWDTAGAGSLARTTAPI